VLGEADLSKYVDQDFRAVQLGELQVDFFFVCGELELFLSREFVFTRSGSQPSELPDVITGSLD